MNGDLIFILSIVTYSRKASMGLWHVFLHHLFECVLHDENALESWLHVSVCRETVGMTAV